MENILKDFRFKLKEKVPTKITNTEVISGQTITTITSGTTTIINEYNIGWSFRASLKYEEIFKKWYVDDKTVNTEMQMLYCILLSFNKNKFNYTFDEFVDILDDNVDSIIEYLNYLKSIPTTLDTDTDKKKENQ